MPVLPWGAKPGGGSGTTNNINTTKVDQTGGGTTTYGTLSGTVNGSNAIFTVSNGAYVSGTLEVELNGQVQTLGSTGDFTETTPGSGTFTLTTAPPTGSVIIASYITASTTSGFAITPLATVTGINGKTVGTTALYTVPAGKTAYITNLILSVTAATAITGGPTASAGVTASAYADLYASVTITALQGTPTAFGFSSVGMFETLSTGSVLYLNITSGSTGTSQTLAADVVGFIR